MTVQELNEEIINVIRNSTETELELTEETSLYEDMGLSSVEAFVMLSDLEDALGIEIPAADLRSVRTVGDLCRVVCLILTK